MVMPAMIGKIKMKKYLIISLGVLAVFTLSLTVAYAQPAQTKPCRANWQLNSWNRCN
jgi:hypothetical protein